MSDFLFEEFNTTDERSLVTFQDLLDFAGDNGLKSTRSIYKGCTSVKVFPKGNNPEDWVLSAFNSSVADFLKPIKCVSIEKRNNTKGQTLWSLRDGYARMVSTVDTIYFEFDFVRSGKKARLYMGKREQDKPNPEFLFIQERV